MGHSQAEKAASRERVLRIAARKVRAEGVTRPGVAELMKEADSRMAASTSTSPPATT